MEKNYMSMSREVEKLRAELTNSTNIDPRTGAPYSAPAGYNEGLPAGSYPSGQNAYGTVQVCRKFERRKYEIAKKLNMVFSAEGGKFSMPCSCPIYVVELCQRKSKILQLLLDGKEVGPLLLEPPAGIRLAKSHSEALKKSKQPVFDIDCEDTSNVAWVTPILADELEERGTSKAANSSRVKKRSSTSLKSQGKARRLVKEHISKKDELLTSSILVDREERKALTRNIQQHISACMIVQTLICTDIYPIKAVLLAGKCHDTDAFDDVEEVRHANNENQNTSIRSAPSFPPQTSDKNPEADFVDSIDDAGKRVAAPSELSCVICRTEFSATRGVCHVGTDFVSTVSRTRQIIWRFAKTT
ncbi:Protein FLX-like 2 [Striga hermonthica]|uniref:Protein FLX-like 2 n=1 Tax=Striga hermonthica TaxID=68872 RepID=A0A9N7NCM2_STRHE|nr:Protein FLX-like 2 [Striga hermonthica]